MRKLWTDEENELIRKMRAQGFTYKQMVPYFPDRNLRTISVQANKLLEPTRTLKPWSTEEEEQLIALRSSGTGYKDIAEIMGRSYSAVKTKGSYLLKTEYSRSSAKMEYQIKKDVALSDLSSNELDFIESGQDFFRF